MKNVYVNEIHLLILQIVEKVSKFDMSFKK